jgi:DNA-binding response OmpR family regulator
MVNGVTTDLTPNAQLPMVETVTDVETTGDLSVAHSREVVDVLVVDDEPDVRSVLAMTFRDAGFSVREAGDATEAFIVVCGRDVRAVVLDVMMPGVDGFQVLNALRSQPESWDIRIAVLTCADSPEVARTAWTLGADDFVTKPIDPTDVVAKVSQLLAASRAALLDRRNSALQGLGG